MRTTKTKYATGFPAALSTISMMFSNQQRKHNLHFFRIAEPDFDAFVCSDELVCRAALFPSYTRLAVADNLFFLRLRHNLGAVSSFSIYRDNPTLWMFYAISFRSWNVVSLRSDLVVHPDFFFSDTDTSRRFSVFFICLPPWKNCRMISVLLLLCFS